MGIMIERVRRTFDTMGTAFQDQNPDPISASAANGSRKKSGRWLSFTRVETPGTQQTSANRSPEQHGGHRSNAGACGGIWLSFVIPLW